jgi:hypothetical protein
MRARKWILWCETKTEAGTKKSQARDWDAWNGASEEKLVARCTLAGPKLSGTRTDYREEKTCHKNLALTRGLEEEYEVESSSRRKKTNTGESQRQQETSR